MKKFNPGLIPEVIAIPIRRMNNRELGRSIKKLAKFFNVDNDLEHVISFAEYYGYTIGSSRQYFFAVDDHSEFSKIATETSAIWDLTLSSDPDAQTVLILK